MCVCVGWGGGGGVGVGGGGGGWGGGGGGGVGGGGCIFISLKPSTLLNSVLHNVILVLFYYKQYT